MKAMRFRLPDFATVGAARLKSGARFAVLRGLFLLAINVMVVPVPLSAKHTFGVTRWHVAAAFGCAILLFGFAAWAARVTPTVIGFLLRPYARALRAAVLDVLDSPAPPDR